VLCIDLERSYTADGKTKHGEPRGSKRSQNVVRICERSFHSLLPFPNISTLPDTVRYSWAKAFRDEECVEL
jgi:hypothetical protein